MDDDCIPLFEHCTKDTRVCAHKGVFPIYPIEFLGVVVLVVTIALCNAAGIGGGELIVAMLIVFFKFSSKSSAVVCNVCIFASSLTRFIMNLKQRNPEKKAISIDYDIVTLMLPVVLLGSFLGVQLNIIVPNVMLLLILTLLLIFLSIKTTLKGIKMYNDESKQRRKYDVAIIDEVSEHKEGSMDNLIELNNVNTPRHLGDDSSFFSMDEPSQVMKPSPNDNSIHNKENWHDYASAASFAQSGHGKYGNEFVEGNLPKAYSFFENAESVVIKSVDGSTTRILKKVKHDERTHYQFSKLYPIVILFFSLTLVSFLRESHKNGGFIKIDRCSAADWMLLSSFILIATIITVVCIIRLKANYRQKVEVGYLFTAGDIKWENHIIFQMLTIALLAGILSGMVGLGGGVIFNLVLLEFGVNPLVCSATGMYMVMLATLSSSILFIMEGKMLYGYAIFLGLCMSVASIIGLKSVDRIMKKYGRPSLLVLVLAGVIIGGTFTTSGLSIVQIITEYDDGKNLFKFNSYC